MSCRRQFDTFHSAHAETALVEVREAQGSTPRETGAWMIVARDAIFGTIGGGQLEFMAIERARAMIAAGRPPTDRLDIALGPEIGQCCGGHAALDIALTDAGLRQALRERIEAEEASRPAVFVFGAGHVGHALADALALLPVRVEIVETRAEALDGMPAGVSTRLTPMPEQAVREAPPGSAFVVLTHDHALDFLIVAEALERHDARYVGMIGSQTKRAVFARWYAREACGPDAALARLTCPIGGPALKDKRPAVIAALVASEIAIALLRTA